MARFWTTHWQFKLWEANASSTQTSEVGSGSNLYSQRGVSPGDHVFVVSLSRGQLYLGRRMVVDDIVDRKTAAKRLRHPNLYEADDWIVGARLKATPFLPHRTLSPEVTKRIRFLSPNGETKEPFFVSDSELDVQATRGVRELSPASAAMLEDILAVTDEYTNPVTVHYDDIKGKVEARFESESFLANEVSPLHFVEGGTTQVLINRFERDPKARQACIELHGASCMVCGFDFAKVYGPDFAGFIHVHHLVPLSDIGLEYEVNPATDLIPICPNCHAAAHHHSPLLTVEELQNRIVELPE